MSSTITEMDDLTDTFIVAIALIKNDLWLWVIPFNWIQMLARIFMFVYNHLFT